MKKGNSLVKNNFIFYFIKKNHTVTVLGILALLYCFICSIYKGSVTYDVSNSIVRSFGDLFYNIGISVIAAYIFLIFQAWLNYRRERIDEKYTRLYIKLYLLRDCELLQMQLKLIADGKKNEKEISQAIAAVCERIQDEIFLCTTKYRGGLSDNLLEKIDALFFDNDFYLIEKRARGQLTNMSMKEILQGYEIYGRMEKLIEEIKYEVNGRENYSMNRNNENIWEKMNEKKHVIGFVVGIVLFIGVVIDYASKKLIPNFVFMEQYSVNNAETYWTWVLGIGVSVVSILTFIHALDQFAFEKRVHRENKEQEKIEKFEELLSTAMDIFDKKVESEIECLRAVQIIKNIIDYTIRYERTNGEKKRVVDDVEKYRIISIDGALVLLKQHLDKVLKEERKSKRQDIKLIIEILYRNLYYKWNECHLEQLGIYNFENLKIDIAYFDMAELSNMRFESVEFCDSKMNSVLNLSDRNVFEKCTFECDINFYAKEFASIDFSKCKLKGFKMQCERGKKYGIKGDSGTRNITIQDCIIDGYFGMSRNSFDTLKFVNSTFKRGVYMQFIRVESEFSMANSEFEDIVDMQSSVFCWKAAFINTVCKKLFYIWDSDFLKKERIYFNNFYVGEFERGNYNARIYANYVEKKEKSEIKKLGDYFETEWNEEKNMYVVKEKSIYVSDDE